MPMSPLESTSRKWRRIITGNCRKKNFQSGQQVLLFNSILRLFPGKLKSKWSGPFVIKEVRPHGAIELEDPIGRNLDKKNG